MGATRGEFCNASLTVFLLLLIVVIASVARTGDGVRAFAVRMPSGERYWTVIDEALEVVPRGACQARRDRPTPATITPGYSNAEAQVAISPTLSPPPVVPMDDAQRTERLVLAHLVGAARLIRRPSTFPRKRFV
jgi:hypothetical protein